jgi:hypothetical protein
MYRLTNKMQALLRSDAVLMVKTAMGMGVTIYAVELSLNRNGGVSIANNYGGVETMKKETGLPVEEIIEKAKTENSGV